MRQSFDANQRTLRGEPRPVLTHVAHDQIFSIVAADVRDSLLAYREGGEFQLATEMAWFDRRGVKLAAIGPTAEHLNPALSPDGAHVIIDRRGSGQTLFRSLWSYDLGAGVMNRLTFGTADETDAVWSPDGRSVAFGVNGATPGRGELHVRAADGSEQTIAQFDKQAIYPRDWSADGRHILYESWQGTRSPTGLGVVPLFGDRKPEPLTLRGHAEREGRFSPDGRLIAYQSDESGRNEIFVQTFPLSAAKWQISTSGGGVPRWRRDGKELFYIRSDGWLMAAAVNSGPSFQVGTARPLFQTNETSLFTGGIDHYAVSADGQRFLLNVLPPTALSPLTVLVNWKAIFK
jgi:Tol biopolymer transport system component